MRTPCSLAIADVSALVLRLQAAASQSLEFPGPVHGGGRGQFFYRTLQLNPLPPAAQNFEFPIFGSGTGRLNADGDFEGMTYTFAYDDKANKVLAPEWN